MDYIPRNDATFNEWQINLITIIGKNFPVWDLNPGRFDDLKSAQTEWKQIHVIASNKNDRSATDVLEKNKIRAKFEKVIREYVKANIAYNPNVTDADREKMGLTIPSSIRKPYPVPTTAPTAEIDFNGRLQHVIYFKDIITTKRAKPEGVHGCEIWCKIGNEPPVTESELSFLATDTRTPYKVLYKDEQKGLTAYYRLRWVNTRGECGPWSAIVSATIAG